MNAKEMLRLMNNSAMLNLDGLLVEVNILDIRKAWGRTDCLITPISGSGQTWVSLERLNTGNK